MKTLSSEERVEHTPRPNDVDARRYQRLRVLGCAPFGSHQLEQGTVLRFTSLDDFLDRDIATHSSRGEAVSDQPSSEQPSKNTEREALVSALRAVLELGRPHFSDEVQMAAIKQAEDALASVSPKEKAIK